MNCDDSFGGHVNRDGEFHVKNIVLVMVGGLLSACAITSVDEFPVRTPRQFLIDVKAVVDSGDLGNVDFVASRLRIDYRLDAKEVVYDKSGKLIEGYGVEVRRIASSKEYERHGNFNYRIFKPENSDFYRAGLSFPIDVGVICVTPYDLIDVLGVVEKYPIAHWTWWAYMYESKGVNSRANFSIDRGGCVHQINISMNRERG